MELVMDRKGKSSRLEALIAGRDEARQGKARREAREGKTR